MGNFHIGQKVVCVGNYRGVPEGHVVISKMILPEVGKVYTVRQTFKCLVSNAPCITVEEIPDQNIHILSNGVLHVGGLLFESDNFRPVVERKTSIETFTSMLHTQRTRVSA